MRTYFKLLFFVLCLLLSFFFPANIAANGYMEDFTTTQYKDSLNTTAWWHTVNGELKLHPFSSQIVGSCNTPGQALGVTLSGNYVYIADFTSGLQIVDISNPTIPIIVGSYACPGVSYDVAMYGQFALVAISNSGLQVIDIGDPIQPKWVGSYDIAGYNWSSNLAVSGNYVCMSNDAPSLQLIKLNDPANPALVGSYNVSDIVLGISLAGAYLYAATEKPDLQVIDISDPGNPQLAGSCSLPDKGTDIEISGDYAYLADNISGLLVIDINNPTSPVIVATYSVSSDARSIDVTGDFAYMACDSSGIFIFDISNPLEPVLLERCSTSDRAIDIINAGEYLYIADMNSGLQVARIADLIIPPYPAGNCKLPGRAMDVSISGDYAFVANDGAGLQIIDISDPTKPYLIGMYDNYNRAFSVAVDGNYAYVTDNSYSHGADSSSLLIIDVQNPSSPVLVGSQSTPKYTRGLVVVGGYVFAACGNTGGLHIIDVSDPSNPFLAGSYDTPNSAYQVAVSGNYAYIADWYYSFQVIDIRDPSSPTLAGSYSTTSNAVDIAISGNYAFLAIGPGLQVFDISDPTTPNLVSSYDTGRADGIEIVGNYAILSDWYSDELTIFDISDPTNITLIGAVAIPGLYNCSDVAGDFIFMACDTFGLKVAQVFQRSYDLEKNTGQSTTILDVTQDVIKVKLTTIQTDSIRWEISADNGLNWKHVLPNGAWHVLPFWGQNLMWRSTHFYMSPGFNPTCTSLQIDTEYLVAVLINRFNVESRESGVEISWDIISDTPVKGYKIYRYHPLSKSSEVIPSSGLISPDVCHYTDHQASMGQTYRYTLGVLCEDGKEIPSQPVTIQTKAYSLSLGQNYPNPFNPLTTIPFTLPENTFVDLSIYNLEGRLIRTLVSGVLKEGHRDVIWDGKDSSGKLVGSGVYFYRIRTERKTLTKKMLFLK